MASQFRFYPSSWFTVLCVLLLLLTGCDDHEAPVIRLVGEDTLDWPRDSVFKDPGYIAFDQQDFDLRSRVQVSGNVDTTRLGFYDLTYSVADQAGNASSVKRVVRVIQTSASLVGGYWNSNNCQNCSASNSSYVFNEYYPPGLIAIDYPFGANGVVVLRIEQDGTLRDPTYSSLNCTYEVSDANGTVSADGHSMLIDYKLQHQTSGLFYYCTVAYTRQ